MKPFSLKPYRPQIIGAPRQPTVALGYPYGGSVTGPFFESVLALQLHELAKPRPLLTHRLPQSGLYIDHNRNRICEKFMDTGADWLLQIDSDISFPPTLVETLLEVAGGGKKILAASVPLGPPLPSSAWRMTDQPGIWAGVPSEEITPEGIEVDGLATAVLIVHRDVLEAIAEQVGQCWFLKTSTPRMDPEAPRSAAAWIGDGPIRDRRYVAVGEDLAFCLRAKDAGFASWCAKLPGLKHHKTLPMSHDFEVAEEQQLPIAAEGGA
jgi:hypothetical protein